MLERRFLARAAPILGFAAALSLWPGPSQARALKHVDASGRTSWHRLIEAEGVRRAAGRVTAPSVVPRPQIPLPADLILPGIAVQSPEPSPAPRAEGGSTAGPCASVAVETAGADLAEGFAALGDDNSTIPADTHGAAGPEHLMVMLNTQVRIQDKTGATAGTVSLSAFWTAGTGLTGIPFDPRIVYDASSQRWMATVDANPRSPASAVWFAISDGSDPTGEWSFYSFAADPQGMLWSDFPGFGFNARWIAISNNMFTVASDGFSGAKMWIIDKASALSGGAVAVTVLPVGFDRSGTCAPLTSCFGSSLQPVNTFDPGVAELFIVDGGIWGVNGVRTLRLSRITGPASTPAWSVVPGSSLISNSGLFAVENNFHATQIGGEQLGVPSTCAGGSTNGSPCLLAGGCPGGICRRVDTGDTRISGLSVYRNGRLWCAHSGGLPVSPSTADRTAVFWYELDPTSMPNPIVQSGMVDGGPGVHHTYPSIAVNRYDDAYVGFSRSDAGRYIEGVGAGRGRRAEPGTLDPPVVHKQGEDGYFKTRTGTRNRWGDFSATVVDPVDDATFWSIQLYAAQPAGEEAMDDRWGTWWSRLDPRLGPCGDGVVTSDEACDDGDTDWKRGQFCNAECATLACGDSDDSGRVRSSDAQFALRAAVRTASCDREVCDVNDSGAVTSSDALLILRVSVGEDVPLGCPPCLPAVATTTTLPVTTTTFPVTTTVPSP